MVPRIILNNIQYLKKFAIVSFCFYLLEHAPPLPVAVKSSQKTSDRDCLILLWNNYQTLGKDIYQTIFKRIIEGKCSVSNCKFTVDKNLQNESSAILFHMPNLHWENYTYPIYRDPSQIWILMSYESATNVRQRGSNWGRYPPINWHRINGVFNRTMSFRLDSDVVVRHGYIEKRSEPLTNKQVSSIYSKTELANFSHYTYNYYREYGKNVSSPIVWFVSHCKAHSGRDKYIAWLQRYIGVDVYGKCGDMKCGKVKNVGNKYDTDEDPCFEMILHQF